MSVDTEAGFLQLVAAAVTPVVLISAAAALIMGINQKHAALADRLRSLAAEHRAPETAAHRRDIIRAQVALFARRFRYAAFAHQSLYAAEIAFVGMVLALALPPRTATWNRLALACLVCGVVLMLLAAAAELLEIRLGRRTVELEIADVLTSA